VGEINPRIASLMFQGLLREALYVKCILKDNRYKDISLKSMVIQLIENFLKAIDYNES
jgi:hypothetical protein